MFAAKALAAAGKSNSCSNKCSVSFKGVNEEESTEEIATASSGAAAKALATSNSTK